MRHFRGKGERVIRRLRSWGSETGQRGQSKKRGGPRELEGIFGIDCEKTRARARGASSCSWGACSGLTLLTQETRAREGGASQDPTESTYAETRAREALGKESYFVDTWKGCYVNCREKPKRNKPLASPENPSFCVCSIPSQLSLSRIDIKSLLRLTLARVETCPLARSLLACESLSLLLFSNFCALLE